MKSRNLARTGMKGGRTAAAAFLAFSAGGLLNAGEAHAAPSCPEGFVALELGAGGATGDLELSGNYGGAPERGGGNFGHGLVGFDAGIHIQEGGGMTSVNPPPAELTADLIPSARERVPEPEGNKRRKEQLQNDIRKLQEERAALEATGKGPDHPEVSDLDRRINVARGEINRLDESWSKMIAEEEMNRRKRTKQATVPCEGPVIGVRGRIPVDAKESSRHDIHPAPSALTLVEYQALWMLTLYIGYALTFEECFDEPVTVTPWAGFTVQRGELDLTTDELGTVSSFSEDVTRTGPSVGVNVDVPVNEKMFVGFGLQGDFLSDASASGTSPLFTYNYGRDNSFEYSGFARVGIRW